MSSAPDLTADLNAFAGLVAERLRGARGEMPQTRAAKQLGVSLRTYQAWEAGASFPQRRYWKRLQKWIAKNEQVASEAPRRAA